MNKCFVGLVLLMFGVLYSCNSPKKDTKVVPSEAKQKVIVDCDYTFEEALAGTKAPKSIQKELTLLDVEYYSTDGKIHAGQVLTNKKIAKDVNRMFRFMFKARFPIAKVIPAVKYHWNDDLSMQDNNTYSFCYRDASYSKHALGMAIDINPFFNPVRWKTGYENRKNKPVGAKYNTSVNGTFYALHPVVVEFRRRGFRWGHTFTRNFDDHHFEK